MIDSDLAELYGVETKVLILRSQFVTLKPDKKL